MVRIYSKNHTVFCPYRIIQAPECVLPDSKVVFRCWREILCSQFRYFGCLKHQNVLFIEMAWTCSGLYLKLFQWYTDEAFIFSANAAQTVSNTSSIMYVQSDILERPSKGQQQIVVTSLISCKHSFPMDGNGISFVWLSCSRSHFQSSISFHSWDLIFRAAFQSPWWKFSLLEQLYHCFLAEASVNFMF